MYILPLLMVCVFVSGAYLRQCGAAEVKMGQALLLYHSRVQKEFLTPLRAFLEVDVKNVMVREGGKGEEGEKLADLRKFGCALSSIMCM